MQTHLHKMYHFINVCAAPVNPHSSYIYYDSNMLFVGMICDSPSLFISASRGFNVLLAFKKVKEALTSRWENK